MWKTLPRMDVIHPCVGRGVRKAEPSHVFSLPLPSSINQFPFLPRSSEVEKLSYEIYNSKIKCIFACLRHTKKLLLRTAHRKVLHMYCHGQTKERNIRAYIYVRDFFMRLRFRGFTDREPEPGPASMLDCLFRYLFSLPAIREVQMERKYECHTCGSISGQAGWKACLVIREGAKV